MNIPKIPPHGILVSRNKLTHKARHNELHLRLLELVNDYAYHTHNQIDRITAQELIDWSAKQTLNPDMGEDS